MTNVTQADTAQKNAAQTTAAQALVKALEDLGVRQVFGIPGVQNIDIYDALYASSIKHVLARHEQGAVHMADGYARATGHVGVVFATSGPGATNTVTGIATAYMDSVPLVVITGQVSTTAIGTDAFQEADITTITLPITKHSYLIKDAAELLLALREAFYLARSGRPGPVLIDVPGNVATSPLCYSGSKGEPRLASYRPTIKGNARQVRAAADLLTQSQRPVILAGGGVVSSGAAEQLVHLAERLNIPVVTTMLAKGVMPAAHPLFIGQPGVYGAVRANAVLQHADLLIALGTRFSERVTGAAASFAPGAKVLHIDIDPAEIGKNIRVDLPLVGDVATVLNALLAEFDKRGVGDVPAHVDSNVQSVSGSLFEILANEVGEKPPAPTGSYPEQILDILDELLAKRDEVIITTDVGQHQLWASHRLNVSRPRRFITSGGLGTMGFGLPAAIGAQVAQPRAMVICVSGDGSFQMNLQEMAVAAVHKLPIKVALFDNRSHGLVRQWQELFLDGRFAHTLLNPLPDYRALAHAYGWAFRSLRTTGAAASGPTLSKRSVQQQLAWLLNAAGPALLHISIPTECLAEPMVTPGGSLTDVIARSAPTQPSGESGKERAHA
ncbi:MAG: biosynthetic-type acetolactate synthase large subunit [Coriobacteriales bacterium]|jgi:acetolactate synthase-1/2/3 large subunit|nr:biosynthetic-type acetolactate synthase large subunit [Coriobacteriales bacterium]